MREGPQNKNGEWISTVLEKRRIRREVLAMARADYESDMAAGSLQLHSRPRKKKLDCKVHPQKTRITQTHVIITREKMCIFFNSQN